MAMKNIPWVKKACEFELGEFKIIHARMFMPYEDGNELIQIDYN
jgi:hypothetical protein